MYLSGFGSYHQTEAEAGALPTNQNAPQCCTYGLYAEQISGTAFTRPRHRNLHSWMYRYLPSVVHPDYQPYIKRLSFRFVSPLPPNPYRWSPFTDSLKSVDFIDGLTPIAGTPNTLVSLYHCDRSMKGRYFVNHDGELIFLPYKGQIMLVTELGRLTIKPGQMAVIPRGIFFKVVLQEKVAHGYVCENRGSPLTLPELGLIGANGLANPRHFLYPQAYYEQATTEPVERIAQFQSQLWVCHTTHSPLSVVAWQGNYAPYSYDLSLFNAINTVSFDHPDPSIYTVLTSESPLLGVANLDLVIFPPRWSVAEHTFRPPYFHKNCMSELMGLIQGEYEAKKEGFLPGGISIHNCMTAHGPDGETFKEASSEELSPKHYENTLAFMFESCDIWQITDIAFAHKTRQKNYSHCWQDLTLVKNVAEKQP